MTAHPHVRVPTRGAAVLAVVALVTAMAVASTPGSSAQEGPTVVRLEGADRYATAAAVSRSTFAAGVPRVLLATGEAFPDALAAGPVAGAMGMPVLLTRPDELPASTAEELDRLDPGAISVLGGTQAVSNEVLEDVRRFTTGQVQRLAGADRYATAARLVDEFVDAGVPVAYVATGQAFPDALAGGPAGAVAGGPLLLVERDGVPDATATTLDRLRPGRIVVLGGIQAVSNEVSSALDAHTDGDVDRLAGQDRYATAVEISQDAFPDPVDTVFLATGENFPDALAGGAAAGDLGSPLLTVRRDCAPDVVVDEVERLSPERLVVLGGTQAVGSEAAALERCSAVLGNRVVSVIQTGLQAPWDVAFTPDGRTFLTERDTGRVLERFADGGTSTVVTLPVDSTGEGGLMGLTVSPSYAEDGLLYVMYTAEQDNRVERLRADGTGRQVIVDGLPKASNHDGGRIDFGPDGLLYVTMGDAGQASLAQDVDRLNGKILRYTPTGGVPADNPRAGSPVWTHGHRNPQGITWDAAGRMFASELGPGCDDELNRIAAGGNYGWPEVGCGESGAPTYVDPILVRQPAEASWSGATVLVDGAIPDWEGDLFVAALRGQRLYRVDLSDAGQVLGVEELLVGEYGRLRHVAQAPDGSLWVLTNNRDGRGSPVPEDDRIIRIGPA